MIWNLHFWTNRLTSAWFFLKLGYKAQNYGYKSFILFHYQFFTTLVFHGTFVYIVDFFCYFPCTFESYQPICFIPQFNALQIRCAVTCTSSLIPAARNAPGQGQCQCTADGPRLLWTTAEALNGVSFHIYDSNEHCLKSRKKTCRKSSLCYSWRLCRKTSSIWTILLRRIIQESNKVDRCVNKYTIGSSRLVLNLTSLATCEVFFILYLL